MTSMELLCSSEPTFIEILNSGRKLDFYLPPVRGASDTVLWCTQRKTEISGFRHRFQIPTLPQSNAASSKGRFSNLTNKKGTEHTIKAASSIWSADARKTCCVARANRQSRTVPGTGKTGNTGTNASGPVSEPRRLLMMDTKIKSSFCRILQYSTVL